MGGFLRLLGIGLVYFVTLVGWLVLGGVMQSRSSQQGDKLSSAVSALWGTPQTQAAPELTFYPTDAPGKMADVPLTDTKGVPLSLGSSDLHVRLHGDPRRKGLVWFALYDVAFDGAYGYEHRDTRAGEIRIHLALPTTTALYDELVFEVNGKDRRDALDPKASVFEVRIPVQSGDKLAFRVGYQSRGSGEWSYRASEGVQRLENFSLRMLTDFDAIDFPDSTLSPSTRKFENGGWTLAWDFRTTVTGQGIGMRMPQHIQPGELAAALSFSAPVSLLFFFVMLFVLATLRNLDIHPINYLFISAAFFSFHLLFAYSVDRLSVPVAFAICSAVSMVLVVSYLRLVVSTKFALRETALAQLVYLVVFSLAHFWEGYTGLTITVLAILTLFVLMQATGRIKWSDALRRNPRALADTRPWMQAHAQALEHGACAASTPGPRDP